MFILKYSFYRCWSKYGLALLEGSQNLAKGQETEETEQEAGQLAEECNESRDTTLEELQLRFNRLDLGSFEDQISSKRVREFVEAREVFLRVQGWLNQAKEFFTIDSHATDYVEICQVCGNSGWLKPV